LTNKPAFFAKVAQIYPEKMKPPHCPVPEVFKRKYMSVHSLVLVDDSLLEIDHIFVCLEVAPQQSLLKELGLVCSDRLVHHPQQGTVSSLIFFENAYLELIWVENETAAEIYAMQSGIDFLARSCWRQTNTSPFGIALRQKSEVDIHSSEFGNNDSEHRTPNSELEERKSEVGNNHKVEIRNSEFTAANSINPLNEFLSFAADNLAAQTEPLCFMIPDSLSLITIEKLGNLTAPVSMLLEDGVIEIEQNASPQLDLTFDDGNRRGYLDLTMIGIPISLKY
jgi:hypothetical protein